MPRSLCLATSFDDSNETSDADELLRTSKIAAEPEPEETAGVDRSNDDDEELEDLPQSEKNSDPWLHTIVFREIDGITYQAIVEDIDVGTRSKAKLYRLRYEDGDLEHVDSEDIHPRTPPSPGMRKRWKQLMPALTCTPKADVELSSPHRVQCN